MLGNGAVAHGSSPARPRERSAHASTAQQRFSPETPAAALPPGVPAPYWLALRGYSTIARARALGKPLLVLHGQRDYQVTGEDFRQWQAGLSCAERVKLIDFPGLNHLFIVGTGPSVPAEHNVPGHVDVAVIEAIARHLTT